MWERKHPFGLWITCKAAARAPIPSASHCFPPFPNVHLSIALFCRISAHKTLLSALFCCADTKLCTRAQPAPTARLCWVEMGAASVTLICCLIAESVVLLMAVVPFASSWSMPRQFATSWNSARKSVPSPQEHFAASRLVVAHLCLLFGTSLGWKVWERGAGKYLGVRDQSCGWMELQSGVSSVSLTGGQRESRDCLPWEKWSIP